jgi:hypothetical protein
MNKNILYSDNLVEIDNDSILVRNYYYPFGNKRVNFKNVDNVIAQKSTLRSGKYRIWGTGDFHTWYPPDDRTSRDKIFIIKLKKKWWRIGLTVENSQAFLNLIRSKCSVIDNSLE